LLIIFLWPLILEPGRGTVVVGRLGCSVSLPCHYKAFQVPLDKLYVYWQFKNSGPDKMAAVVIKGRINKTYQHGNYQGRGQMDPLKLKDGDFTFSLSSLTKGDEGIYHCIVMKDDVPMTTQYNISLRLRVDALFTVPTITRSGSDNRTRGSETTLICTSHGGLLRPRVWWVKSTDGSHLGSGQMLFKKHKDSWNVTSIITLNVTQSINLTCSVENPTGNITSPTCESPKDFHVLRHPHI
ncbi:hypothetical protein GDO86_018173, partial [Hymenochirus boettgeri]